jgi:glutaconate CoA-transferase subunit B
VASLAAWDEAARAGGFAGYLENFIRDRAERRPAMEGPDVAGAREGAAPRGAPEAPVTTAGPEAILAADRLIVGMARRIADGDTVVTGLASALPMLAVAVARATHAPRLTYINCVGAVDPLIERALPTSVDPALLEGAASRVLVTDFFDLARRGRIDVMFFGAAQVDAASRMNLSSIGDPLRPKVKLPGPAGSTSIRPYVRKVVVLVPRHAARVLVGRVDFASSVPSARNAETWVVSDLALLRLEGEDRLCARRRRDGARDARADRRRARRDRPARPGRPAPPPGRLR